MSRINSISRRVRVTAEAGDPALAVTVVLRSVIESLGPDLLGHAKAIAHCPGGAVHGSTTGMPPVVDVTVIGDPENAAKEFEMDVLCVFHGLSVKRLSAAWQRGVDTLIQHGFHTAELPLATPAGHGALKRSLTAGTAVSVFSSVVALKPCCLLPAVWSLSGAAFGTLNWFAPLEPYRPAFLALSAAVLAAAFYRLYVRPLPSENIVYQNSRRRSRQVWWAAALFFMVAAVTPLVVPPPPAHDGPEHVHH